MKKRGKSSHFGKPPPRPEDSLRPWERRRKKKESMRKGNGGAAEDKTWAWIGKRLALSL